MLFNYLHSLQNLLGKLVPTLLSPEAPTPGQGSQPSHRALKVRITLAALKQPMPMRDLIRRGHEKVQNQITGMVAQLGKFKNRH